MLKANHPDGTEYFGTEVLDADLGVDDPHEIDWRCTVDDCPMQFVNASRRTKHFRHDIEKPGHPTPEESEDHRSIILGLKDYYEKEDYVKHVKVEYYIKKIDRIADLKLKLITGHSFVIEVQLSEQSKPEFRERTNDYNKAGMPVLWLLGYENYLQETATSKKSGYIFKEQIKWLQGQYFGRFYFVAPTTPPKIYPTKFEKESRYVEGNNYHNAYTKYYDTIAKVNDPDLEEFEPRQPRLAYKDNDYYNGTKQFDVVTFGLNPWWN